MGRFEFKSYFIDSQSKRKTIPLIGIFKDERSSLRSKLTAAQNKWLEVKGFEGVGGDVELFVDDNGNLTAAVIGLGKKGEDGAVDFAGYAANLLPDGAYHFEGGLDKSFGAALAFGLGAYKFNRYKSKSNISQVLIKLDRSIDIDEISNQLSAVYLGRDLINIPANDLGPAMFEKKIKKIASLHKAQMSVIKGDALLSKNFPMIHTVGRASNDEPMLVELKWGKKSHPAITLVGKGICYDTGGLNLKPGNAMALMKKDMGGAATALTLASLIMGAKLRVNLRVLLPIAENSVAGNSFRPGDVIDSRRGLTVEIGNTDAEGRLVLADALSYADEAKPDAIFCFATLTGAARVGLGPDLPPFYTDDEPLAKGLEKSAGQTRDFMWRMPFWNAYDKWLSSKIADVNHISEGGFAGSITAALFLRRFVENTKCFVHFDIYGWTPKPSATKPHGAEPQTARAVFDYLKKTYG